MKVHTKTAFKKWKELVYGSKPTHNVIATERMVNNWEITDLEEIPYFFARHPNLSPVTFNIRLAILKRFVKWCVKQKYLRTNVLEDTITKRNDDPNPARDPFTDEELQKLIEYFQQTPRINKYYYPFMMFLIYTGVRNGEAIALRCDAVDFVGKRIHICKNWARPYNGSRYLKSPKTSAGKRYLPLSPALEDLLQPLCINKEPTEFVFKGPQGKPINDANFQRRVFAPALKKLGIRHRHLYAFRHTFGTVAVEQNMDILSVAYLMGHRKTRTVLDHYSKLRNTPKTLPEVFSTKRI